MAVAMHIISVLQFLAVSTAVSKGSGFFGTETLQQQKIVSYRGGNEDTPFSNSHCPRMESTRPVFLPNPTDCSSFYLCVNGIAYRHRCPSGLHYNRRLKVCSYPVDAQCMVRRWIPSFICPAEDPDSSLYFPDEMNCSQFYQCSNGVAFLHECPPNLHFDADKNVCVHPSETNCNVKQPVESSENVVVPSSFLHFVCPAGNAIFPAIFSYPSLCPALDHFRNDTVSLMRCTFVVHTAQNYSFLNRAKRVGCKVLDANAMCLSRHKYNSPHPYDCKRFFRCSHGVAYLHSCPRGLYFDSQMSTCNYPHAVNCLAVSLLTFPYISL